MGMGRLKAQTALVVFILMVSTSWIVEAPSLLAQPHMPMSPTQLVRSFEDLLGRQAGLLHSFEMLIGHFEAPPVQLLGSFEDLLHRQADLLHSYEKLAKPFACTPHQHPELALVASFERLLHGQAKLLGSFEALLHRHPMPPMELVVSFERLLRGQTELLHSFEGMLHCLVEIHHLPPRELFRFAASFEGLLRAQGELLKSFEALLSHGAHTMPMPIMHPMPPYGHPMEPMLPSLDEIIEFAHQGHEMMQQGKLIPFHPALVALMDRLRTQLERFKKSSQMMRAEGRREDANRREAQLAEFRSRLIQLQGELLKKSLMVETTGMAGAPGTYQITVENRGPFSVTLATLLLYDGPRMIHSQSLGTLEPGARRMVTVRIHSPAVAGVRAMATGFIDLITKLMAAAMSEN
jgi:hypothetical protein